MYRADQHAFVQNMNVELAGIRLAEITYFQGTFANFGTQSAFIAGFLMTSISAIPTFLPYRNDFYKFCYLVSTIVSFILSMDILVSSIILNVYGQGYALRGPSGSLIKAVNRMVVEQRKIMISFTISIVSFAFSNFSAYFIVMEYPAAVVCAVVTFLGVAFWHHYTVRIYNRFKWNDFMEDSIENNDPATMLPTRKSVIQISEPQDSGGFLGKFSSFFRGENTNNTESSANEVVIKDESMTTISLATLVSNTVKVLHEGHLYCSWSGEKFNRRYCVVKKNYILVYDKKETYRKAPTALCRRHPIYLLDYHLFFHSENDIFTFELKSIDERQKNMSISFVCDSLSEALLWIEYFGQATNGTLKPNTD